MMGASTRYTAITSAMIGKANGTCHRGNVNREMFFYQLYYLEYPLAMVIFVYS